jgi:uncharacterized membrane protein (Fun14 family)
MEIPLDIPKSITIPDWGFGLVIGLMLAYAIYIIYRIFYPKQPEDWIRGG